MARIITINLNGVRSAARKGFFNWLKTQNADLVCVQELKAQEQDMQNPELHLEGYHGFFHFAEKKGYSGVGIYTRHQPDQVVSGLGWDAADLEGRYVAVKIKGLWIASLYLPSGTSGEDRQQVKYDFLDKYAACLRNQQAAARDAKEEYIICGDWNIAHKKIDLKNWRSNQKNSGFLPEERAWMDRLFSEMGFVDAFREINQEPDQYTWWSNRGQAWTKNVGWRIDYQVVTPGLKPTIKSAKIYKEQRFSDHAPLMMDYDIML
ncbi:Exodeoxyribonuclease [Aquicella siphonis]|uniref:Exodeoxyribonuclease n=1 Tax=Aquicella siphonis TaxID=254247 RepID=A0A5E4PI08_9COXI|nr:exodeoxyribonuclease III [Aquicella siphonis]VVC76649.1 Exodeoxyribonuclease [Aquicella siphonis]